MAEYKREKNTHFLLGRVKNGDTKAHQNVPTSQHPPQPDVRRQRSNNTADEDGRRTTQRDDVGSPPIEQHASDDGKYGVDECIGAANDAELRVGDVQLLTERVLQRRQTGLCPSLTNGQGDDASKGDDLVVQGDLIGDVVVCMGPFLILRERAGVIQVMVGLGADHNGWLVAAQGCCLF